MTAQEARGMTAQSLNSVLYDTMIAEIEDKIKKAAQRGESSVSITILKSVGRFTKDQVFKYFTNNGFTTHSSPSMDCRVDCIMHIWWNSP